MMDPGVLFPNETRLRPHRPAVQPDAKEKAISLVTSRTFGSREPGLLDMRRRASMLGGVLDARLAARLRRAASAVVRTVDVDTDRAGGVAVLKGTRFAVAQLMAQIAEGDSVDDLVEQFDLDRESIRTFLLALSDFLARPISNATDSI
jgi:uncharacterized protein (DUF433 family)